MMLLVVMMLLLKLLPLLLLLLLLVLSLRLSLATLATLDLWNTSRDFAVPFVTASCITHPLALVIAVAAHY